MRLVGERVVARLHDPVDCAQLDAVAAILEIHFLLHGVRQGEAVAETGPITLVVDSAAAGSAAPAEAEPEAGEDDRGDDRPDTVELEQMFLEKSQAWQRTLYDNGWAGLTWPKEFGGRGGTPAEAIIFGQEAAEFDVTWSFKRRR